MTESPSDLGDTDRKSLNHPGDLVILVQSLVIVLIQGAITQITSHFGANH